MIYITNCFEFSISIKDDIVNNLLNINNYIKEYIDNNILNTNKDDFILIELIEYDYDNPIILPNMVDIKESYKLKINTKFKCIKLCVGMIIKDLSLITNNKIDDLDLYKLYINENLNVTCVDINNFNEDPKNIIPFGVINDVNINKKNIKICFTPYSPNIYEVIYSTNYIDENFKKIIIDNIDINFKFKYEEKNINIKDLLNEILSKKGNEFKLNIINNVIKISVNNNTIITKNNNKLNKIYFNNLLMTLYNYYIYNKK